MDSTTLLLVVLLIAVLAAIGLLAVLVLRRPEERIGGLLRDEQRAGRGELREQLDGFALQQGQRIAALEQQLAEGCLVVERYRLARGTLLGLHPGQPAGRAQCGVGAPSAIGLEIVGALPAVLAAEFGAPGQQRVV